MKNYLKIVSKTLFCILFLSSIPKSVQAATRDFVNVKTDAVISARDWRSSDEMFAIMLDELSGDSAKDYGVEFMGKLYNYLGLLELLKSGYNYSETGEVPKILSTVVINYVPESLNNEVVIFPDKNLEAIVREEINKPTGEILKRDVKKITFLSLRGYGSASNNNSYNESNIEELTGIENLTNLMYLDLSHSKIKNIKPLKGLTKLRFLNLESNKIDDIEPLSELTNLTWLYLSDNQISSIDSLKGLTNLTLLKLKNNQIKDYSPISSYYKNITVKDFILNY